jgi:hypothetical protein
METAPLLLSDARSHESGAIASGVKQARADVAADNCFDRRTGPAADDRNGDDPIVPSGAMKAQLAIGVSACVESSRTVLERSPCLEPAGTGRHFERVMMVKKSRK